MFLYVLLALVGVIVYLVFVATGKASRVDKRAPTLDETADKKSQYKKGEQVRTTDGTAVAPVRYAKSGFASEAECPTDIIPNVFRLCAERRGDKPALFLEENVDIVAGKVPPALPLNMWKSWTWQQYYDDSRRLAKALINVGVKQHDAVNIFGFNSPEWFMAQMGTILAGAKAAGIYPTDTPAQVLYKTQHSRGAVAIVDDEHKLNTYLGIANQLPYLKAIVCWSAKRPAQKTSVPVYTFDEFLKRGDEVKDEELEARIKAQKPGHCCGLIYTSGTTGNPKAVMITHDNLIYEASLVKHLIEGLGTGGPERVLSYLPLSHVAGLLVDIICPIIITSKSEGWFQAYFARPYDLKNGTLGERLRAVHPTIFLGVPRVWEKISEKMKSIGASTKGVKKALATWAKDKGLRHQRNCQLGGSGERPAGYPLADKLVLSKVKAALGLDECKFGLTGAAPIQTETLEYFGALGIQVNEVYGMSECTGAVTISTGNAHVWGSCGWAMNGLEMKIFQVDEKDNNVKKECPRSADIMHPKEEEQGEICYRGRNIMMGYLANPDMGKEHLDEINKKSAEAIDDDGWLHSGDKGCLGVNGMLRITGRFKELIIGAGGENIAPVPIEDAIKRACPAISNVMMIGDKQKFNVAFVTLKLVGATGDLPGTNKLDGPALQLDTSADTIDKAIKSDVVAKAITDVIVKVNKDAAVVPNNASKIQRFTILPRDFSVVHDDLTPTLKTKRSFIEKKHAKMLKQLYAVDKSYVEYDLSLYPDPLN